MREALVAVPDAVLDVAQLVAAAQDRWPGAVVTRDQVGNVSVAWSHSADAYLELAFHPDGHGVGVDGEGAALAAEAVVWLLRAASVSPAAGGVLVGWAPELVPLDGTTTVETLLVANERW